MNPQSDDPRAEVRLIAEALVDVLAERGLLVASENSSGRVMSAAEVAAMLGRDRQWVYDHAGELGAFRYGQGPKARLGFDVAAVARWKREQAISQENRSRARPRSRGSHLEGIDLIPYERPATGP